jgi:RNA polymerase sigma-70 factor (ECF subfamily)
VKINKIFNGLPEKCKRVFLLSRYENLSNSQIATNLNITISTVEKHISKALKMFGSQGIDSYC